MTVPALVAPAAHAVSFEDMERMADAFARSQLFGARSKEQALALLLIAQAEGIHPALAVMEYDIIEGKPARKAERLLARFQMSGGKVQWVTYSDTNVTGKFSHPQGSDVEIVWTIEAARKITFYKKGQNGDAGRWVPLTDKYNWKSWPRAMLRSRCISEGVRACFPGASLVTLTSEEAQDVQVIGVDVIDDDVDQRPDEERVAPQGAFMKGKAAKDAVDAAIAQMDRAVDLDELAEIWRDAQRLNVSENRHFALAELHARNEERLRTPSPPQDETAPTAFDKLKSAGLECLEHETPQQKREALDVWAGSLTPAKLEACTEEQRDELRALFKNIKAEIEAA